MNEPVKILIVEDEPVILRSIRRGVEQLGETYQVSAAAYDGREALEKMRETHPDIVISDIVMPQMGGLEMIEEAQKRGIKARFILLSGYEEFGYARKALDMGVVKYLLKPVDFQELGQLLEKMKEDIISQRRKAEEETIRCLLSGRGEAGQMESGAYYFIALAVWGNMGRSGFYDIHPAADIIREMDTRFLRELEELYGKAIYGFPGYYANSYLFIIPASVPCWNHAEAVSERLFGELKSGECFLTLCYTRTGVRGSAFRDRLRDLYCEIPAGLTFGKNTRLRYPGAVRQTETEMGNAVRSLVDGLHMSMDPAKLRERVEACCRQWEARGMTQLELQAELRYLFESPRIRRRPDLMELLYRAYSYRDLAELMITELSEALCIGGYRMASPSAALVEAVKQYLDIHFAEEISYKEFNRIFGYNEKYITTVFRQKMGVTPSKYVLDKKMDLARELLSSDAGLLLRDVAQRVGYSDQLYFSKVFKNCTGMSPTAYMRGREGHMGESSV